MARADRAGRAADLVCPDPRLRPLTPGVHRRGRTGRVVRVERPRLLEYTWDGEILRFELTDDGEHACKPVFTKVVDGPETGSAVAPGWEAGLDLLAAHLDGF
ncbi:hypothetical protein [Amycolatopsis sp. YIM 10]|uniref:hypothetical protein n=1 Tax=Amycolatopsis sp. YIM 10 TaxID=2653857 RepID=UPI0012905F82|nr:hypothetical protein [Amycolatopsis sp. YIM 10]